MIDINNKKMCESCFAQTEEEKCPHCGYSKEEFVPDPMVLPLSTKLENKILIGRVMGKGGFGITYLGYDLRMEKAIAVKEYYPNGIAYRSQSGTEVLVADPKSSETFDNGLEKFYTEAEMVAQFNGNPNIVGVYDYFRTNNTVYLIMEYLNGITLKNYVKKHGKINDGQALFVMDKMAAALSITHSAGVLHRDISPDNIMVCMDGKIKLIDFGAARQIMAESSSNLTVVMKPGYTPIEQYTKKGRQGAWTDIYALGASIYFAMTEIVIDDPYERMDNDDEFTENRHGINETLWSVIKKCTMINGSDRYGSAIELRKALTTVSAPVKPEKLPLDSDDVKAVDEEESREAEEASAILVESATGPIEVFTESGESTEDESAEDTPVQASGYNPDENVYAKTEKVRKPLNKKLLFGVIGGIAAAVVIAVGAIFILPRLESSIPASNTNDAAEKLGVTPLIHLDFETDDGLTAVVRTVDTGSLSGAEYGIEERERSIILAEGRGAVGSALYLDGTYGVDFDMVEIDDDSYTISFWYNAERIETFSPVVQMGRNVGMSGDGETVTWINFTKCEFGSNNAEVFPVAWNRNTSVGTQVEENGIWPWIYAMDNQQHGIGEWCMVTVVADGSHYTADEDGMERVGTKFYLNGELMLECSAENKLYQGLSPYIFAGDGVEGHIGINYWDSLYKGYVDELYVFDEALTAEQVKQLYEMGDPPAAPSTPDTAGNKNVSVSDTAAAEDTTAPVDSGPAYTLDTTSGLPVLRFELDDSDPGSWSYGKEINVSDFSSYFDSDIKVTLEIECVKDFMSDGEWADAYSYILDIHDKSGSNIIKSTFNMAIIEPPDGKFFFGPLGNKNAEPDGGLRTFEFVLTQEDVDQIDEYIHFRGENCFVRSATFEVYDPAEDALSANAEKIELGVWWNDGYGEGSTSISKSKLESFGTDVRITLDVEGELFDTEGSGLSHLWVRDMVGSIPIGVYIRNHGLAEAHAQHDGQDDAASYVLGDWTLMPKQIVLVITAEQIHNLSSEDGLYFHILNGHVKAAYLEPVNFTIV